MTGESAKQAKKSEKNDLEHKGLKEGAADAHTVSNPKITFRVHVMGYECSFFPSPTNETAQQHPF